MHFNSLSGAIDEDGSLLYEEVCDLPNDVFGTIIEEGTLSEDSAILIGEYDQHQQQQPVDDSNKFIKNVVEWFTW